VKHFRSHGYFTYLTTGESDGWEVHVTVQDSFPQETKLKRINQKSEEKLRKQTKHKNNFEKKS